MRYETTYDELLARLPEKVEEIEKSMASEDVEPDEGMHIIFGEAVVPLLIKWTLANDPCVEKAFLFLEEMASCDDDRVGELLEFTILETFVDLDRTMYSEIKKRMGPQALACCEAAEEYLPSAN